MLNRKLKLSYLINATIVTVALSMGVMPVMVKPVIAQATSIPSNTTLSLVVPSTAVDPGAAFDITVVITTDVPTTGAGFEIVFDPALIEINAKDGKVDVVEGNFYKDFAAASSNDAHEVTTILFGNNVAPDNAAGIVKALSINVLGYQGLVGVKGSGTLLTVHAKAKAAGNAALSLRNYVVIADFNSSKLTGLKIQNANVGIGAAVEQPTVAVVYTPTPQATATLEPTLVPTDGPSPTVPATETATAGTTAPTNTPVPGATAVPTAQATATSDAQLVVAKALESPTPAPAATNAAAATETPDAASTAVATVVASSEVSAPPVTAVNAAPASDKPVPKEAPAAAGNKPAATIAPRKATPSKSGDASVGGGGPLPLEIIIPGVAVVVVGGILALVLRRR